MLLAVFAFGPDTAAQPERSIWYFGDNAGLDFNGGAPVPVLDGMIWTTEGSASICDFGGSLLFYTDGLRVWNAIHQQMPNGFGLLGDLSSSQSAIIVQRPGSSTLYHIFTSPAGGSDGLYYSVVDMTLDGGYGDVVAGMKNILLVSPICEKVTAVQHANGIDHWVLTKEFGSTAYHAFLLTDTGVQPGMITSNVGVVATGSGYVGYMKTDPAGTRVAVANRSMNVLEVLDFDNNTGVLTAPMTFTGFNTPGIYGVEFSPNGQLLYVSESASPASYLYQYDLLAGTQADIASSRHTVDIFSSWGGAIQMGPDCKIYHALHQADHLGVINDPDQPGAACNYVQNGLYLGGAFSRSGLPGFVATAACSAPTIVAGSGCFGDSVQFSLVPAGSVDSVVWDFGDPGSGAANSSTDPASAHSYSDTGSYVVTAHVVIDGTIDTLMTTVMVHPIPEVELGADTTLCAGTVLILDATLAGASYFWQDSSMLATYVVAVPGTYWVTVTANGCSGTDSIVVDYLSASLIELGPDTAICDGESVLLDATLSGATYLWHDGATGPTYSASSPGDHSVTVTLLGCTATDTIGVSVTPLPDAWLGNDTTICMDSLLVLDVGQPGGSYLWQDGSTGPQYDLLGAGTYWIQVTAFGCANSDSVQVMAVDCATPVIEMPNVFSPNGDGENDEFVPLLIQGDPVLRTTIWNRWGQLVYTTSGPPDWDGRTEGREHVPEGTYYWELEVNVGVPGRTPVTGVVTLLR